MESSGVSKPSSCLPNSLTFRSDRVQPGATRSDKHGNYEFLDSLTPVNGDCVDFIPTYIGGRYNELASDNTYTEEVVGSGPIPLLLQSRLRSRDRNRSSRSLCLCWQISQMILLYSSFSFIMLGTAGQLKEPCLSGGCQDPFGPRPSIGTY